MRTAGGRAVVLVYLVGEDEAGPGVLGQVNSTVVARQHLVRRTGHVGDSVLVWMHNTAAQAARYVGEGSAAVGGLVNGCGVYKDAVRVGGIHSYALVPPVLGKVI